MTFPRLLAILAFALAGDAALASAQGTRYTVHDLDLGQIGGTGSAATLINDAGVAVGYLVTNIHDTRAARAGADGVFEVLPGLASIPSDAQGINADGDIAGGVQVSSYPNWAYHAMRYTNQGGIENLGTLGGASSFAYRINRQRQVAGMSYVTVSPFVIRAFLATPGQPMLDLGTFSTSPYASSVASGINDAGQVAGHAETSTGRVHVFRYTPGVGLQDLTPAYEFSFASDINAAGQVVGRVVTASGDHAFRYSDNAGLVDLHGLGATSNAYSLNDRGEVVGSFALTGQPSRAFLYTDAEGMIDLNSRIDPASGWVLNAALGINAAGEIVGQGTYRGGQTPRAFKLTPGIADTVPPTIDSASSDPGVLWPPDGKMVDVQLSVVARDDVDASPRCSLTSVAASEGDVSADSVVTGALSLRLRADRNGNGPGREYRLTVVCADAAGNRAQTVVTVRTPHDIVP
jgi:probable HAF family extracellular repeat protein